MVAGHVALFERIVGGEVPHGSFEVLAEASSA
jgi:hypothetical protein